MQLWHVTSPDAARTIQDQGFEPGWGDAGLGVYFFSSIVAAEEYAASGGWDGSLDPDEAVILEVECDEMEAEPVIPHPEWPNPERYASIMYRPMEEDDPPWWPAHVAPCPAGCLAQ